MSITTKASILWVILLQGRQFATGQMDILAEFSALHSNLTAKQANIYHAEVPAELLKIKQPLSKKRTQEESIPDRTSDDIKKVKLNHNTWHPKIKAAMLPAMKQYKYPKFLQILNYCSVDANDMYQKFGDKCTPNVMFGTCYARGACKRDHSLPSDKEVDDILFYTKKFCDLPNDFKAGS